MKLLFVYDESQSIDYLENLAVSNEFTIHTLTDPSSLIKRVKAIQPELILINPTGLVFEPDDIHTLLDRHTPIPYLIFSQEADDAFISMNLNRGAADFLNLPLGPKEIMARIYKAIHLSHATKQSRILSFNDDHLQINVDTQLVLIDHVPISLTKTEFTILHNLAANPNRIFSRSDLMEGMRGLEFTGSDRAIDSHIKNIRLKIEKDSKQPEYILTVHGSGYRFGSN